MIACTSEKPLFAARVVLPKDQTTLPVADRVFVFGARVPFPQFAPGRCIESNDLAGGRGGIEHTGDNEIIGLVLALVAGVVGPGNFELSNIAAIDLVQGGIVAAFLVAQ